MFSPDYPPRIGGIAAYSNGIARGLSIHCKVIVLAPRISGFRAFDRKQPYRTIRVVNLPVMREIIFLFTLIWLASTKKINFIYNTVWFPCGIISLAVHFLFGTPYSIAAHASEILDDEITLKRKIKKKFKKLKILALKKAQLNFSVSHFTKDKLIHMGVPPEKIVLIPNGVDSKWFHPDTNSSWIKQRYGLEGKRVLLTVARLDKHKGHDFVLRALRSHIVEKFPNVVYLIVGEGPERKNLQKLADYLDLNEKVIFVGLVKDDQIPAFYNCCDVFIMPSREIEGRADLIEGFGIAYLEANACAKPVIGGRSGGTQDAVIDGQTGLLVDPTNIRTLSEAVCKLLSDNEYASLIGRQGRKRTEDFLSWEKISERVIHSIIRT